jgi:hypothetical protein
MNDSTFPARRGQRAQHAGEDWDDLSPHWPPCGMPSPHTGPHTGKVLTLLRTERLLPVGRYGAGQNNLPIWHFLLDNVTLIG